MGLLQDKIAIITGGGRGIGAGVARAFAKEGAHMVICGRTEKTLLDSKEAIERISSRTKVLTVVADVTIEDDARRVVDAAIKEFGKLDILVNNAQSFTYGVDFKDQTKEDFDEAFISGVYGTFYFMKAAYPYLRETRGSVINFGSDAGLSGTPGQASYAAAKEAIRAMSRVTAREWGPDGIRVNVICPMALTKSKREWGKEHPDLFDRAVKGIPLGRFGDPEKDIGQIVVFLASDMASYLTGETLIAEGGSTLR